MKQVPLPFTPIIIIGAGRSGTNMLRDALTKLPDFATWDCDEINPIWRHGNVTWPDDEIPVQKITKEVKTFIRNEFIKIWKQTGQPKFIVEKTCANSLRVDFVYEILPEAKFIYIVRDGFDVVASAKKRWKGDLELPSIPYYWSKLRYAPLSDIPIYAFTFLKNKFFLAFGTDKRLSVWGPRFKELANAKDSSLDEICALQWLACIKNADDSFAHIDVNVWQKVSYEKFTSAPLKHLEELLDFIGSDINQSLVEVAAKSIHRSSIGKGKDSLETLPADIVVLMEQSQFIKNSEG